MQRAAPKSMLGFDIPEFRLFWSHPAEACAVCRLRSPASVQRSRVCQSRASLDGGEVVDVEHNLRRTTLESGGTG